MQKKLYKTDSSQKKKTKKSFVLQWTHIYEWCLIENLENKEKKLQKHLPTMESLKKILPKYSIPMTLTSNLPVYKATYDLTLNLFTYIKGFQREFKYTLWEQLKQESIALIMTITKANMSRDKKPFLEQARSHIETVRILLRLSKDLHLFTVEKFVTVNQSIESISRQVVAREKSVSW